MSDMSVAELVGKFDFSRRIESDTIPLNVVLLVRIVDQDGNGGIEIVADKACDSIAQLGIIQAAGLITEGNWRRADSDE